MLAQNQTDIQQQQNRSVFLRLGIGYLHTWIHMHSPSTPDKAKQACGNSQLCY